MYGVTSSVVISLIIYLWNRVMLRPSGQDEDVFTFTMGGPNIDCDKILTSREELVRCFHSITKRTDIVFGDIVWISKYRSERGLLFLYST